MILVTYIEKFNCPLVQTTFEAMGIRKHLCIGWRSQLRPNNEPSQAFCRHPFPQRQREYSPTSAGNLDRSHFDGFLQSIYEIIEYAVWEELRFVLFRILVPEVF
jgi:hypothetical protein